MARENINTMAEVDPRSPLYISLSLVCIGFTTGTPENGFKDGFDIALGEVR